MAKLFLALVCVCVCVLDALAGAEAGRSREEVRGGMAAEWRSGGNSAGGEAGRHQPRLAPGNPESSFKTSPG